MLQRPAARATRRADRNLVRLGLEKIGQRFCRHAYVLVLLRDRLFLRCDQCGAETRGFTVAAAARGYTVQAPSRRAGV